MLKKIAPTHLITLLVILVFVIKSVATIVHYKGRLHDQDTGSEENTITAARNFLHDGFTASCGLPKYGRYNLDSPSKPILDSDYYTHYFPGPDYVLALVYKVFSPSVEATEWARLIPFLHFLLAALLFLWIAQRTLWPKLAWATPVVAALVLFAPADRPWVVNLHGHGYVSAYTLLAFTLGLLTGTDRHRTQQHAAHRTLALFLAALLGFASNYMLLTNAFVVCAAPLIGALLAAGSKAPEKSARILRQGLYLSTAVGLGLVAAYAIHLAQIACLFNWHEALLDQLGTFSARIHKIDPHVTDVPATRLQLLGRYNDQVFGFFGLSALAMLCIGLLAALVPSAPRRSKSYAAAAMVLSILAAYAWILALPSHARGHLHVNPRIFLLPWLCLLCVAARGCQNIRQP